MKLFYHLFGSLLAGMIILVIIDEYISYTTEIAQFEADLKNNTVQDGQSIAEIIKHIWRENGEHKARKLLEEASAIGRLKIRWLRLDELEKSPLLKINETDVTANLARGESVSIKHISTTGCTIHDHATHCNQMYTYIPVNINSTAKGALEIRQSLRSLEEFSQKMVYRAVLITLVLAVFFGTTLYFFIAQKIGIPVKRLMLHAKRIGEGNFSPESTIKSDDELEELSATMNDMCSRLLISKEKIRHEHEARLKAVKKQLRHTERLSSLGVLSATIAHELGTPLNVIEGRAKMIMEDNLDHKEIEKNGDIIKKQCQRMTQSIRQLLDFSRRPHHQEQLAKIDFLVKQIFQLLYPMAKKQQVTMSMTVQDNVSTTLYVDEGQIQQLFVNLILNAIQAMKSGGRLTVHISKTRLHSDDTDSEEKYLTIRISDEGGGIAPENMNDIFIPFFTTKSLGSGTGLGLSIAHEVAQEHGGWITAENIDNGSCFTIYLPIRGKKQWQEKSAS